MKIKNEDYSNKNPSSSIKEDIGQGSHAFSGVVSTPIGMIKVDANKLFGKEYYYLNLEYHYRGRTYYRRIERKKRFSSLSMSHHAKRYAKDLVWSTHVGQVKEFYPDFEKKDCRFTESCICEDRPCSRLRHQY